jgi:hypothetical protein
MLLTITIKKNLKKVSLRTWFVKDPLTFLSNHIQHGQRF